MEKTRFMATISNGKTFIERRVYLDREGFRCVRINKTWFKVADLFDTYRVDCWIDD